MKQNVQAVAAYPPDSKDHVEGFGKAELDAGDTVSPGQEFGGKPIEYFQPNKSDIHEVASPVERPPPPDPVYEMPGDGANLPELPAPTERPHEAG
jgi:hypothetical protein